MALPNRLRPVALAATPARIRAMSPESTTTNDVHAKALAINLDSSIYGTVAEIGAGQEVARWFLRVGAASGTVAQTICAYDKTVSDERYGAGSRYVSRERLLSMLDREYGFLLRDLAPVRGATTRFFAFADTVAARNYRGDNQQHGWVGIRFQTAPGASHNDILLHVNLMDPTAQRQQEALGVLGVNLIHAAYHCRDTADRFLAGLFDQLSIDRLEIDVIELTGPAFADVDPRCWCLQALRRCMTHALVFDQTSQVTEPSNVLRKRPLIVQRGRFARLEPFHADMLDASERQLRAEDVPLARDPARVVEMTTHHAASPQADPALASDDEVLSRVDRLTALAPVIVSDYAQTYRLVDYLRRHTSEPVRLALGASAMAHLLQRHFYDALPGNLIEGLGKLLATNVRLYVYPMPLAPFRAAVVGTAIAREELIPADPATNLVTALDLRPRPPLDHLYRYLLDAGWIVPLPARTGLPA